MNYAFTVSTTCHSKFGAFETNGQDYSLLVRASYEKLFGSLLAPRDESHTPELFGRLSYPSPGCLSCDTETMELSADPKTVKVNLTTGTGMEIEWKDGHRSEYSFTFLRDACPCALCEEERGKQGRRPGDPATLAPGTLPMYKPKAKPTEAAPVGKYAIRFHWNDGHELGIYSWQFLREVCPCEECKAKRTVPQRA
ncbi:MAG TPA: DUF971 domain-containing protein [Terriglobales bacterium]|nr:DUF971 domain-containing protein [Terriglobales bacterium]